MINDARINSEAEKRVNKDLKNYRSQLKKMVGIRKQG
jgi:hypothetical protein